MPRPSDLMRRALPYSEWPQADQRTWEAAHMVGDVFGEAVVVPPLTSRLGPSPAERLCASEPCGRVPQEGRRAREPA
jgi:hypothetical protein